MSTLSSLSQSYAENYPSDFALEISLGSVEEIAQTLNGLPGELAATVSGYLSPVMLLAVVQSELVSADHLFLSADLDKAALVLNKLPREQCLNMVNTLSDKSRRRQLRRFLNYPAHSVGAVVANVTLSVGPLETLISVKDKLKRSSLSGEPDIVVVDDVGLYLGVLDPWQLLNTTPQGSLVSECISKVEALRAESQRSAALLDTQWDRRNWLPVVDHENRFMGVCWRAHLQESDSNSSQPLTPTTALFSLAVDFIRVMAVLFNSIFARRRN